MFNISKRQVVAAILFVGCAVVGRELSASPVVEYVHVGSTKDWCRDGKDAKFQDVSRNFVTINKQRQESHRVVRRTEMVWYCGNSDERVANDKSFDMVSAIHNPDGRIFWDFYRIK